MIFLEEIICLSDQQAVYALLQTSVRFAYLIRKSKVWSKFKSKKYYITTHFH
jgi:hypothetical protein